MGNRRATTARRSQADVMGAAGRADSRPGWAQARKGMRLVVAADLVAAHAAAYRAGRHAHVIAITQKLNALRGLQPKRVADLRDDVQRDHDEEREHGWVCG